MGKQYTYAPARFVRAEEGGVLVEFAMVLSLFLVLFFGLIDFGRIGFSYVMASKSTERAVRLAVVRGPACGAGSLPLENARGVINAETDAVNFGQRCNLVDGLCLAQDTVSCTGSAANPTASEIWTEIQPLMPTNAGIENLKFTYEFDSDLGYLGGPYTPVVTVEIVDLNFEFVSPLGALATLAASSAHAELGTDYPFPPMSASLPAEDLQQGESS